MSLCEQESEVLVSKGVLISKEHYIPVMFDTQTLFPVIEASSCWNYNIVSFWVLCLMNKNVIWWPKLQNKIDKTIVNPKDVTNILVFRF